MMNPYYLILTFMLALSLVPAASAIIYCDGPLLRENITVSYNVISIATHVCSNGCYDNITAFGGACGPPRIEIVSIGFILIIAFIFFIFTFPRLLKRGKR